MCSMHESGIQCKRAWGDHRVALDDESIRCEGCHKKCESQASSESVYRREIVSYLPRASSAIGGELQGMWLMYK